MTSASDPEPSGQTTPTTTGRTTIEASRALRPVLEGFAGIPQETRYFERGEIFMLHAVPELDPQPLCRHAEATVCPSLREGFDYSNVESRASAGIAVSFDIPVHQKIFEDASEYFDPCSSSSLLSALTSVLDSGQSAELEARSRRRGPDMVARYNPEETLPQGERFIERLSAERRKKQRSIVRDSDEARGPASPNSLASPYLSAISDKVSTR